LPNDSVIKLIQPGTFDDQLTEVLRNGARTLLTQAIEAEVSEFLAKHADLKTPDGHQRVVRHGRLPEREVMTGIGPVAARQPRVRDREAAAGDPNRIRFTPAILPPYARRSKSLGMLIPILYLKGISTGDFEEALAALLGQGCARPVGIDRRAVEGGVDRGTRTLAEAISRPGAMSMCWRAASTCRRGLRTRSSAFLSLLARRPKARRS
jgi:hypothetical protein